MARSAARKKRAISGSQQSDSKAVSTLPTVNAPRSPSAASVGLTNTMTPTSTAASSHRDAQTNLEVTATIQHDTSRINSTPSTVAATSTLYPVSPSLSAVDPTSDTSSHATRLSIPLRKRARASVSTASVGRSSSRDDTRPSTSVTATPKKAATVAASKTATTRSPSAHAITAGAEKSRGRTHKLESDPPHRDAHNAHKSRKLDEDETLGGVRQLRRSTGTDGSPTSVERRRPQEQSDSPNYLLLSRQLHGTTPLATTRDGEIEADEEGSEVFVDASATPPTPPRRLSGTPTSQLLSQLQDQPYAAVAASNPSSTDKADTAEATALALFTPATVPRRRLPPAVAIDVPENRTTSSSEAAVLSANAATAPFSSASPAGSSASRSSYHDPAVQAILRANPPTTTRAAELKPGYQIPSPRSPLWAALDAEDDDDVTPRDEIVGGLTSGRSSLPPHALNHPQRAAGAREAAEAEEEMLTWSNTQVSLFQEDEDERERDAGHHQQQQQKEPQSHDPHGVPTLTATQERRRFDFRRSPHDRLSLPLPGRSVNLLDEEGLHEDERLPLFVGERDGSDGDTAAGEGREDESFVFSLTQEAMMQERAQDHQAALPRSRQRRETAGSSGVTAVSGSVPLVHAFTTPSPARRGARAGRQSASPQASPFSQLQRDVAQAAAVAARNSSSSSPPASASATAAKAAASPSRSAGAVLSQRELRRRADMLKWAERTRAFFHFIDTRPLHVANSPAKARTNSQVETAMAPQKQQQQQQQQQARRSRSQALTTATAVTSAGITGGQKSGSANASSSSMSLVRRSHSVVVVPALPPRRGSAAFEAVVSRVKREAAAAAKQQKQQERRSTATTTSHTPAQ